jgi:hypothetical protein
VLTIFPAAVGLNATFSPPSAEDFKQRLMNVHDFPEVFAVTLAENMSLYRDNPDAWVKGTDFALREVSSHFLCREISRLLTFI